MANFPGATPSFAGFTSSHTLAVDNHASQHNLEQGEIVALANKIGTGASTPTSGLLLRGTGAGTSSWAQANLTSDVTGVLPQANGGTGTTLATGTGKAVYDTAPTISNPTLTSGGSWAGSPILTTPVIADFTNATHNHSNAASGGSTLTSPTITTPTIASILNSTGVKLQLNVQTDNSDAIANTTQAGIIIQAGWGQVLGDGVNSFVNDTITFPSAFTTVLGVCVSLLPVKATPAATTIANLTTDYTTVTASIAVRTTIGPTGCGVVLMRASGSFAATNYYGYSWMAWGI